MHPQKRQYFFNFSAPGDYTLELVAYLRGCVDSTFAEVTMHSDSSTITGLTVAPAASINLRAGPNPNMGAFTVTADLPVITKAKMLLYGSTGQLLLKRVLTRSSAINERFELAFPAGVYFLYLPSEEGRWVVPVVIM